MNENETISNQVNCEVKEEQQPYNNYYNQGPVKKKKGPIFLVIFLLIIIAGLVGGYMYFTTAAQYYKNATNLIIDKAVENILEQQEYETAKVKFGVDVDFKPETNMFDEDILELINKLAFNLELQQDKKAQSMVIGIDAEYDKENLIDANAFINAKDEKTYIYVPELLDKYIEAEMKDYSTYNDIIEIFEMDITEEEKENARKLKDIIKKELTKYIRSEFCSKNDITIKINDKDVKTSCKTIQVPMKQLYEGLILICDNLNDQKVYDLIKEEYKEDVKDFFETLKEELEIQKENMPDDVIIKLNTYTIGLLQEPVKIELIMQDEKEENSIIIDFTKEEEQNYLYSLKINKENVISGNIKLPGDSTTIKFDIPNIGKLEVEFEMTEEYNIKIDKVDENKAVKPENLKTTELLTLANNLKKSNLYDFLSENGFIEGSQIEFDDIDILGFGQKEEDDDDILLDTDISTDEEENDDIFKDIDSSRHEQDNQIGLKDNQIYTYDNKTLITFGLISGYKFERIADEYQTLSKDGIKITISSEMCTNKDEYYEQLKDTREYFNQQTYYSDVTLSNMKSTNISGNTFYQAILQYKYDNLNEIYEKNYIWAQVSDDYVVEIEIDNMQNMTKDELKQLLTMTFEDKKD